MKKIFYIFLIVFCFSCSSSSDEENTIEPEKFYLYKRVDVTDGKEKVNLFDQSDCRSKSNSYFISDTKFSMQLYDGADCSNSTVVYDYDPVKNKIQIYSYLYYSVKKDQNTITLQTHYEVNDDPNYTTIYYFEKK